MPSLNANFFGISFSHPERWPWIFALLAILLLMSATRRARRQTLEALGAFRLPEGFAFRKARYRGLKEVLFVVGSALVFLSFLGPQWGQKPQTLRTQGLDLCLALDLSASMLAEDVSPSRLQQAKNQTEIFLGRLGGDRAALVGFAGTGFVAAPLSPDGQALAEFLQPLEPHFFSDTSTDLGSGLEACEQAFGLNDSSEEESLPADGATRVILLISDGEETADLESAEVQRLKKLNIPVFSMAIGTTAGGKIPVRDERGQLRGYVRSSGEDVITKLEDAGLKKLAKATGGQVFYSSQGIEAWKSFEQALANFQRRSQEAGTRFDKEERFQWPLAFGLLFLLFDFLIPETAALALLFLLLFTPAAKAADPWEEIPLIYLNRKGVGQFEKENLSGALESFRAAVERDAGDLISRYNWATSRLFSAVHDKKVDKEPLLEALREFQTLLADPRMARPDMADFRKVLEHQLAQAYEANQQREDALEHYYKSLGLPAANPEMARLDARNKDNITRLLASQSGQGGGGKGEGEKEDQKGQGQKSQPNTPPKEGEDVSQEKQKARFNGTDLDEQQAGQILQSVSGEEQEILRRKTQADAKETNKKPVREGSRRPW